MIQNPMYSINWGHSPEQHEADFGVPTPTLHDVALFMPHFEAFFQVVAQTSAALGLPRQILLNNTLFTMDLHIEVPYTHLMVIDVRPSLRARGVLSRLVTIMLRHWCVAAGLTFTVPCAIQTTRSVFERVTAASEFTDAGLSFITDAPSIAQTIMDGRGLTGIFKASRAAHTANSKDYQSTKITIAPTATHKKRLRATSNEETHSSTTNLFCVMAAAELAFFYAPHHGAIVPHEYKQIVLGRMTSTCIRISSPAASRGLFSASNFESLLQAYPQLFQHYMPDSAHIAAAMEALLDQDAPLREAAATQSLFFVTSRTFPIQRPLCVLFALRLCMRHFMMPALPISLTHTLSHRSFVRFAEWTWVQALQRVDPHTLAQIRPLFACFDPQHRYVPVPFFHAAAADDRSSSSSRLLLLLLSCCDSDLPWKTFILDVLYETATSRALMHKDVRSSTQFAALPSSGLVYTRDIDLEGYLTALDDALHQLPPADPAYAPLRAWHTTIFGALGPDLQFTLDRVPILASLDQTAFWFVFWKYAFYSRDKHPLVLDLLWHIVPLIHIERAACSASYSKSLSRSNDADVHSACHQAHALILRLAQPTS